MIHALYTFHQHIIYVYFRGAPDQVLGDVVNHSLEGSPNILDSEGHHFVAVDSPTSNEGSLIFIWWMYFDLTIPRIGVHDAKKLVAHHRLY